MEIRQLRVFREVVERGGFSSAARALGSTQSTVSKAVGQLEHECGLPLLDRSGRSVRPTAAGRAVYRRGLALLREREGLLGELADLKGLRAGRLTLGLPPLGSGVLFANVIADYRRLHPGVEIVLRESGGRKIEAAVMSGELEVGITLPPAEKGLAWREIRKDSVMALLPPAFAWPKGKPVRLRDLAREPFVLFEEGFALNTLLLDACRKRGIAPVEAARSGQPDFIMALVAAGLGVGFLPRIVVEVRRRLPVRAVLLEEPDVRWTPGLVWRKGRPLSPPAQAWADLLKKAFGA